MQYNSEANGQDICTLAQELVSANTTSFPIAKKTRYANIANRLILSQIFFSYGGWKYDDRNHTDFPIGTTDLVQGQRDYSLPVDAISLEGVYIQNELDDEWTRIYPLTLEEINAMEAEPSFNNDNGVGTYYRVIGNSIKLYPAVNYAKTDGLMIEYSRDISTFAVTDTTKTPAFDPIFHEAIAIYMAYQYAQEKQLKNKNDLQAQWIEYLARIKKHYGQKFRDKFPIRMKVRNYINQFI